MLLQTSYSKSDTNEDCPLSWSDKIYVSPQVDLTTSSNKDDDSAYLSHIPPVTMQGIKSPPMTQDRPRGRVISKRALKGLACGRLIASIQKDNVDMILYNDQPQFRPFKEEYQRRFNMEELYQYSSTVQEIIKSTHYDQLPDVKSLQFLSFKKHPELWVDTATDEPYTGPKILDEADKHHNLSNSYLNHKTSNTSMVEQDTNSPDIRRVGGPKNTKNVCVVVGDPGVIATALDSSLSYADSCDRTFRGIYGLKPDTDIKTSTNMKRSNDFPVLVALKTKTMVTVEGKEYMVDFGQKTEEMKCRTTALLLSSLTEAIQRVQVLFLEMLYDTGDVHLNKTPIDRLGRMYRLDDTDKLSQIMNFHRSDTVLYQVRIWCTTCLKPHHNLWIPNDQKRMAEIISTHTCEECESHTLVNHSSFMLREANCRQSLDPGASRKINYEVPRDNRVPLYPTGIESVEQLQPYELVSDMTSCLDLELDMSMDAGRKNQRTRAVTITLYIPTSFDQDKTLAAAREQLQSTDFELTEDDIPNNDHCVDAYVYHDGKEHQMKIVATRFKVSLSCNKTVDTIMSDEVAETLKTRLGSVQDCVQFQQNQSHVQVHVPSNQTCKRMGVQTVYEEGEVHIHSSPVIVTPLNRQSGKRQNNKRVAEEGPMMTATNCWCHPNFEKQENFLRYGQTLLAAFVNNVYNQGILKLGDTRIELLPKGMYDWIELDEIHGTILPHIREEMLRKVSAKVAKELLSREKKIKELGEQLNQVKKSHAYENDKNLDSLTSRIEELEESLRTVTKERDELKNIRKELERELRAIRRQYVKVQDQYNRLCETVEEQKRIEAKMQGELDSLKLDNTDMRKKTDMLIESVEKYGKMLEAQAGHQTTTDCEMEKVEAQKTPQPDIDWFINKIEAEKYGKMSEAQAGHQTTTDCEMEKVETQKTPQLDIDWVINNIEAEKTPENDWFLDFDLDGFL